MREGSRPGKATGALRKARPHPRSLSQWAGRTPPSHVRCAQATAVTGLPDLPVSGSPWRAIWTNPVEPGGLIYLPLFAAIQASSVPTSNEPLAAKKRSAEEATLLRCYTIVNPCLDVRTAAMIYPRLLRMPCIRALSWKESRAGGPRMHPCPSGQKVTGTAGRSARQLDAVNPFAPRPTCSQMSESHRVCARGIVPLDLRRWQLIRGYGSVASGWKPSCRGGHLPCGQRHGALRSPSGGIASRMCEALFHFADIYDDRTVGRVLPYKK